MSKSDDIYMVETVFLKSLIYLSELVGHQKSLLGKIIGLEFVLTFDDKETTKGI